MTRSEELDIIRQQGKTAALDLRGRAADLTGTQIIAEERNAPAFDPGKDYTGWPVSAPVTDEGQVWLLIIPHNAAAYPGLRPSGNRACWGLAHTTDPARAKPYVAPYGTSGLYMAGECCTENGSTYRSTQDNNPYAPSEYPDYWELASVQGGT